MDTQHFLGVGQRRAREAMPKTYRASMMPAWANAPADAKNAPMRSV
jgi:hypothetical protein